MRLLPLASTALLGAALFGGPHPINAADEKPIPAAVEAMDGQSLRLQDGSILRLAGIIAPDAANGPERRMAEEARQELQRLAVGKKLQAQAPADRRDRHDRRLLQIKNGDGKWLQGELLQAGLARVWTQPDAIERAGEMLALEAQARESRRGLWALPYFAILSGETAPNALDRFQIVEFTVLDVARVRGSVYLNAGRDWRSDLTARLERPAVKLFADEGQDVTALKGRTIRMRGWLRFYNGAFMDISHPQQIEVVGP
jgi:micrococcal nuclease